jgi:hypothetical protein
MTKKLSFIQLKPFLLENEKTFTAFLDIAGSPPSRRTWNDGTHLEKGVGVLSAKQMQSSIERVFNQWGIIVPNEVKTPIEIN